MFSVLSRRFSAIALLAVFAFSACEQMNLFDAIQPAKESQEYFDSGISFPAVSEEGGVLSVELLFTATDAWSVSVEGAPSWLSVVPPYGDKGEAKMKVSAQPNSSEEPRILTLTISCGKEQKTITVTQQGAAPAPPVGGSLTVVPSTLTLEKGKTAQLKAVTSEGTPVKAGWSSGNTKLVQVDQNGLVKAVEVGGPVTVTASFEGKTGTCTVNVKGPSTVPVQSVSLAPATLDLETGATGTLTATVLPENATDKTVTWTTSASSIATVSGGVVKAVAPGEATITAKAGEKQAQCKVTVKAPAVPEVVDLGLSVKWRAWNLGASAPEEYGDYYAWGEVEPYYSGLAVSKTLGWYATGWKSGKSKGYNWESNRYRTSGFNPWDSKDPLKVSKYNTIEGNGPVDNKVVLEAADDPANKVLGGAWRTPTQAEWQELLDGCTSTFVQNAYIYVDGVKYGGNARKFTSKKNGNSILIPIAGYFFNKDCYTYGTQGSYWSSSLVETYISDGNEQAPAVAWYLCLYGSDIYVGRMERYEGLPIRPVLAAQQE